LGDADVPPAGTAAEEAEKAEGEEKSE